MTPKKPETKPTSKSTEPTKPTTTPVASTSHAPAPQAQTTPKASRFVRALESQVAAFVQAQKLSKVSDDLALFVAWSQANPPAEKVSAPAAESATGKVWSYCDALVKENKPLVRKAVIDALVAQGLNPATVSTQYQRWTKARGVKATVAA